MEWKILGLEISPWIYAPAFLAVWVTVGLAAKGLLSRRLGSVAARAQSRFVRALMRALSLPILLLILVSGLVALSAWTPLGAGLRQSANMNVVLAVAAILAIVLFVDRLLRELIDAYSESVEFLRTAGGLLKGLQRGVIVAVGGMILLDTLGISVTPIIASLGIGSLAVALALQPTLENLFAGMQIVIDRPILPGHFIRLETGEEGYVDRIGWRSTWIRMLPNNMIIIPNKQLVGSRVINYCYPSTDLAVLVQLGVHYASDLDHVERVTVDVGKAIMKSVQGGVSDFEPFIRFHTFGGSSIDFTVILRAREFVDNYLVKHEFIKALQKRYAEERIVIPFPIRAINLEQEGADRPGAARPS